jgi:hypothetical protein
MDPIGLEEMQGVRELESRKQVIQLEVDVSHKDKYLIPWYYCERCKGVIWKAVG